VALPTITLPVIFLNMHMSNDGSGQTNKCFKNPLKINFVQLFGTHFYL